MLFRVKDKMHKQKRATLATIEGKERATYQPAHPTVDAEMPHRQELQMLHLAQDFMAPSKLIQHKKTQTPAQNPKRTF